MRIYYISSYSITIAALCFCEYSYGFGVQNGIMCGSNGDYERVTECSHDHWCTGYANDSSQVATAMDLCEKGNIKIRSLIRIIKVFAKISTKVLNVNQHPLLFI